MSRTKPYIFNVSMHKVATRSIHAFIESLGYQGIHHPRWLDGCNIEAELESEGADTDRILGTIIKNWPQCDLFSDVPIPGLYREAANAYPESYFILATRDPQYWWNTLRRHWNLREKPRTLDFYEYIQYAPYGYPRDRPVTKHDAEQFKQIFVEHERKITELFSGSKSFLKVDIDNDPVEQKIGQFFGVTTFGDMPYLRTGNQKVGSKAAHILYKARSRFGL